MAAATAPRSFSVTTLAAVSFWAAAALLSAAAHSLFRSAPAAAVVVLKAAVILVVACVYMRIVASSATLDHALFTGVTWLLLAIFADVATHTRFELLGPPASAMRNVLMFAWVMAPALFARYRSGGD